MAEAGETEAQKGTQRGAAYRVLARKYRPGTFAELIGQEALVRTLKNAIDSGRLAHAFVLTGVRGVGKTTTARLIAKALNCVGPDGTGGPTADPCGQCEPCRAIAESRLMDVIEMDAASHTGVDDVREIIDSVQYAPASARYKVYIIDEVHMLSKNAFNALLKTLEEPPPHVKFIFATTEIRKVPVTVLSRCQRFDLRRVEMDVLIPHFSGIAQKEGAQIDDQAIAMIARAADGSVRDGLSLLDQAIAHGSGTVDAAQVRTMLGLADREQIFDLFEQMMGGDIAAALTNLKAQDAAGAEAAVVLSDLLELVHWLTELKVAPQLADQPGLPEAEAKRGKALADKLSLSLLSRVWQMLLKGLEEVRFAPQPRLAADMVLIRIAHGAGLPGPEDLLKQIPQDAPASAPSSGSSQAAPKSSGKGTTARAQAVSGGQTQIPAPQPQSAPQASAEGVPQPQSFDQVIAWAEERNDMMLVKQLTDDVHLVAFKEGRIELRLGERAQANLPQTLSSRLSDWTGQRWIVSVSQAQGEQTRRARQEKAEAEALSEARQDPLVQQVLGVFTGAEVTRVTQKDLAPGMDDFIPLPDEDAEDEDES